MAWNRAIKNSNMDTTIDNRSDIILHIVTQQLIDLVNHLSFLQIDHSKNILLS